jgi:molybdenum cofactor synthesis domain-containing protein
MSAPVRACLIMIGNEILSGKTKDKNLSELAVRLNECGIRMSEARVIPDIEETIIATVNECRAKYDYVFTTGGIGPTHDDITSASIAKAFNLPLIRHPEAETLLRAYYEERINEARLKMAETPEGATLIPNRVSVAPGFIIGNVYVLAGVPSIMQAMMDELKPQLKGGDPVQSIAFNLFLAEGDAADRLTAVQKQHEDVEIGIYPRIFDGVLACHIVLRCSDADALEAAFSAAQHAFGAEEVKDLQRG